MTKTTDSTRGKSTVSETVEKFSFGSGQAYLGNAEVASAGLRFDIVEIKFEPGRGYEGHDRWLVTVKVADREPEQLSLGSNPGRDQQYATMADLLDAANVSWNFYVDPYKGKGMDFSGAVWNGFDAIKKVRYGPDWTTHISRPNTNFFNDVKNGTLPSVSWVMPSLADSDHPASGCNHGPRWITSVVNAVGKSKYWKDTAVVLMWDDWGGWYDSVPPPQVNYTSLGFRVPMIVISPFAKRTVVHTEYNFGSVLKFIEQTFGLGSLGVSDASANSIGDSFDFSQTPIKFQTEPLPKIKACSGSADFQQIIEHDNGIPE